MSIDEQLKALNQRWLGKKRRLKVVSGGFGWFYLIWESYDQKN